MIFNSTVYECVENLKEKLVWLSVGLSSKKYTKKQIAKVIIIIFGPIISTNHSQYSLPFIPWWELTDTNFVKNGFENLGMILDAYYNTDKETIWNKECKICIFNFIN